MLIFSAKFFEFIPVNVTGISVNRNKSCALTWLFVIKRRKSEKIAPIKLLDGNKSSAFSQVRRSKWATLITHIRTRRLTLFLLFFRSDTSHDTHTVHSVCCYTKLNSSSPLSDIHSSFHCMLYSHSAG